MADQVGYKVRLLSKLRTFTPAYTHTDSVYTHYIGRLEGVHTDTKTHRHTHTQSTFIQAQTNIRTYSYTHTHACIQTNIHVHDTAYVHTNCIYVRTYLFQDSLPAHDEGTTYDTF